MQVSAEMTIDGLGESVFSQAAKVIKVSGIRLSRLMLLHNIYGILKIFIFLSLLAGIRLALLPFFCVADESPYRDADKGKYADNG